MFIRYLCQYFTETQAIFVHRNGAELSLNGRTVKKKKKKKKKKCFIYAYVMILTFKIKFIDIF